VPVLAYGNFITVALNFLILAFIIFLMVKQINRLKRRGPGARTAAAHARRCAAAARDPRQPAQEIQGLGTHRGSAPMAAIRLDGSALPLPARSKAVP
jgi:hypothetical protein